MTFLPRLLPQLCHMSFSSTPHALFTGFASFTQTHQTPHCPSTRHSLHLEGFSFPSCPDWLLRIIPLSAWMSLLQRYLPREVRVYSFMFTSLTVLSFMALTKTGFKWLFFCSNPCPLMNCRLYNCRVYVCFFFHCMSNTSHITGS